VRGDDLRQVRFQKVRSGYSVDAVQQLLESAAAEVEAGRSPYVWDEGSLPTALLGYDPDPVEQFLLDLRHLGSD